MDSIAGLLWSIDEYCCGNRGGNGLPGYTMIDYVTHRLCAAFENEFVLHKKQIRVSYVPVIPRKIILFISHTR